MRAMARTGGAHSACSSGTFVERLRLPSPTTRTANGDARRIPFALRLRQVKFIGKHCLRAQRNVQRVGG